MWKQLGDFFRRYARGRGVTMADKLAKEIKDVLSVQAPIKRTRSGRIVASTKATPFAPPRKVTGKLQKSVRVQRTRNGAKLIIDAPYGLPLETSTRWWGWPHKFIAVAMERLGLRGRFRP